MNLVARPFWLLRLLALALLLVGMASTVLAATTYSDNGDGTVTDSTTGLTWMRCSMGQTWTGSTCSGTASSYSWAAASDLPMWTSFAGRSDWRLPNIRELQTIVDWTAYSPAINATAFPNTPSANFWSATPGVGGGDSRGAWYVVFDYGGANGAYKSTAMHARLVRGGQLLGLLDISRPTSDYVDHGDGTVTHTPTGLTWKRCAEGQTWSGATCSGTASTLTWDAAKLLASTYAGSNDWRMPIEEELLSLVDYAYANPAINTAVFPNAPNSYFWSASTFAYISGNAWHVNLDYGSPDFSGKINSYQVRLLRTAGQAPASSTSTTTTSSTSTGGTTTTTTSTSTSSTSSTTAMPTTTTTVAGTTTTTLASSRYYDNGDGTVTDPLSSLMWMRCSVGQAWDGTTCMSLASAFAWEQAMALAGTVSFAGKGDWRLPTPQELQSIFGSIALGYPIIDSWAFPNTPDSSIFWSNAATTGGLGDSSIAIGVGGTAIALRSSPLQVRLVRTAEVRSVNVDLSGAGSGTISSYPVGITCGATCSANFPIGPTVTLSAKPALGSTFAGWSGACTGTGICALKIDDVKNVTATFKPEPFKAMLVTNGAATPAGGVIPGIEPCPSGMTCTTPPPMTVAATISFNSDDVGKSGAVFVTAMVPSGSLVPVQVPGSARQFVLIQLTSTGWLQVMNGQLMPYASGVLGDQLAVLTILDKTISTNALYGAQFCVGYGSSAAEMIAAGRMQLVALIPDPNVTSADSGSCIVDATEATTTTTTSTTTTSTTTTSTTSTTLPLGGNFNLVIGWNLVGNGVDTAIDAATTFADANRFTSIWKWIAAQSAWAFHAPSLAAQGGTALADYVASKGYQLLTTIAGGEGFWVNAKTEGRISLPSGNVINVTSLGSTLVSGWNLVSIAETVTPKQFCDAQSSGITTLWVWDAANTAWYFYAPSLDTNGTLGSYIASKAYLDFTLINKRLEPGVGFWVNKP